MRLSLIAALWVAMTPLCASALAATEPYPPDDLQVTAGPSPLECLQPPRDQGDPIAYPPARLERRQSGVVRLRMRFTAPDLAPEIETFYSTGDDFTAAVQARVRGYRVPCLGPGAEAVVAMQEFQFMPEDDRRIVWSDARDARPVPLDAACFQGLDDRPIFPRRAADRGEQGVVIARMTFSTADTPPRVDILFDAGSRLLADAVRDHVADYRFRCFEAGRPLVATREFQFVVDGEEWFSIKDATLSQFLAGVRGIAKQRVRFDLGTMGCPFELKLKLLQPYLPNRVGEVGRSDPNRFELIAWLKTLALDLPERMRNRVIGETMTIAVPCGLVDLH